MNQIAGLIWINLLQCACFPTHIIKACICVSFYVLEDKLLYMTYSSYPLVQRVFWLGADFVCIQLSCFVSFGCMIDGSVGV